MSAGQNLIVKFSRHKKNENNRTEQAGQEKAVDFTRVKESENIKEFCTMNFKYRWPSTENS